MSGLRGQEQPARTYGDDCTRAGCHDDLLKHASVHDPVESVSCEGCHEKKEGEEHAFTLAAEGGALCLECHDDPLEEHGYVHGPVAAGACMACHDPHASDHPSLLTSESPGLCLQCHSGVKKRMTETTFQHEPAKEDCMACHHPHGSDLRLMLKAALPGLCTDCHDDIAERIRKAKVKHEAVTKGSTCAGCHDPHGSDTEQLLSMKPMALCMYCHSKSVKAEDGKELTAMGPLLENNPDHHGPIRKKDCTSCHTEIHGGEHFRLLAKAYPPEFYAPYDESRYGLCFICHEPDRVRDERTETLTGFRNGDINLHYLHVHRRKGRTCRACHETHASKNPFHIRESVPFGDSGWKLPIRFEKTPNGGSCLCGCHKRYRYDRVKPAVNKPSG